MYSNIEEGEMLMALKDWRKAIRTPPSYRVGKTTLKLQPKCLVIIAIFSVLLLFIVYQSTDSSDSRKIPGYGVHNLDLTNQDHRPVWEGRSVYNSTYPITKPLTTHDGILFKIGVVADMDHSSLSKLESNTWMSQYLRGTLIWNAKSQAVIVSWDPAGPIMLKSKYSHSGRGMELSELITFDGKLLSVEDRSGIVYVIEDDKVYPWVILLDGSGKVNKGFKSEWATVKDEHLIVGSMGKEWTTPTGEFVNNNPLWIKKISRFGEITHISWRDNYLALRSTVGISFPGYMLHESGLWSDIHKKWFFLPRRMSHDPYNEEADEHMGTNILLIADESFKNIEVVTIGEVLPTHGFSSFKFIPGTKDEVIVALKSYEVNGRTGTYILAFTIQGKILLGETKIDDYKFEGFEFI